MLHAVKLTTKISAYLSPKIACLSLTCWQWYSVMFACHASCAVLGVDWLWDWGRRRGGGGSSKWLNYRSMQRRVGYFPSTLLPSVHVRIPNMCTVRGTCVWVRGEGVVLQWVSLDGIPGGIHSNLLCCVNYVWCIGSGMGLQGTLYVGNIRYFPFYLLIDHYTERRLFTSDWVL